MKVQIDCFPCFFKQTLIAARLGTDDEALQTAILKGVTDEIKATDMAKSPAYSTTFMHRKIRQVLGKDPFRDIKSEYNQAALLLYPELSKRIFQSSDPLWTATRIAIAGNIIDFGIFSSVDIAGTVERALNDPMPIDDYSRFRQAVDNHDSVLYLLDNSGEIVFDRLLIELLTAMGKEVTAVVKGSPVLNDSTADDAVEAGLTGICNIIDNGCDCIGTILEMTSPDFNRIFGEADFIISKGQGNFETLGFNGLPDSNNGDKEIFFLLQAKCHVVSNELGLAKGSMLLLKGGER